MSGVVVSWVVVSGVVVSGVVVSGVVMSVVVMSVVVMCGVVMSVVVVSWVVVSKDKFRIEPRYAHTKKNLNKSGGKNLSLETDHPRSLKFDTFLFFEAF